MAGKSVRAVTHRCTYPDEAKTKPRAITSPIDPECMSSLEIDTINSKMQHEQKSAFVLNEDVVRQANPDFIISQNTCEVCAAHTTHVGNVIHILNEKPKHTMNELRRIRIFRFTACKTNFLVRRYPLLIPDVLSLREFLSQ